MTVILAAIAAVTAFHTVSAQHVAIGEKAPKVLADEWMDGRVPAETEYTCIIFIHSHNQTCIESVKQSAELLEYHPLLSLKVLTREDATTVSPWLREIIGERSGVALNADGDFARFDIQYAPFAVTLDRKRRVMWFGNPERVSAQIDALIRRSKEK